LTKEVFCGINVLIRTTVENGCESGPGTQLCIACWVFHEAARKNSLLWQ